MRVLIAIWIALYIARVVVSIVQFLVPIAVVGAIGYIVYRMLVGQLPGGGDKSLPR